jgi:SAM-dependent methyltransferase
MDECAVRRVIAVNETRAEGAIVCPCCHGALSASPCGLTCAACSECFDVDPETGTPDFRLRTVKVVSVDIVLPAGDAAAPPECVDVLRANASPEVVWAKSRPPVHLDPLLMSYVQRPSERGALALDLGCGGGEYRGVIEYAGYEWVGLDCAPGPATVLGDAQALPFADAAFDQVISLAVLEHVRNPLVFAREAYRVLRPGRRMVGSVAFLEPLHGGSYYHHTHRGLWNTLTSAGFEVTLMAASPRWTVLRAQSQMALFPHMPKMVASGIVMPLQALHLLWWLLGSLVDKNAKPAERLTRTAAALYFVATKPRRDTAK